jgi:hypothetical protein
MAVAWATQMRTEAYEGESARAASVNVERTCENLSNLKRSAPHRMRNACPMRCLTHAIQNQNQNQNQIRDRYKKIIN